MPRFTDGALDANQAVLHAISDVGDQIGATPAQVALAWLRQRAQALGIVSVPIPGTRRAARVDENAASLSIQLTDAQLGGLDAAAAAVTGDRFADLTWVSAGRE